VGPWAIWVGGLTVGLVSVAGFLRGNGKMQTDG
jgi:hypothetical protein